MVKFCRNCGKELAESQDKTCPHCGASAVKATAHCRYCGKPTTYQDVVCPTCGASVKPLPGSARGLFEKSKLAKWGKIVDLTLVVLLVSAYVIFSLPKSITRPIKSAASDAVMASTGYTALPLDSISSIPTQIPLGNPIAQIAGFYGNGNAVVFNVFEPGDTRVLSIYATYKNDAGSSRFDLVTGNCTFRSSNENIAKVDGTGAVTAVADGTAYISVNFTAPPGSDNRSAAAVGKVPVTFTARVKVIVTTLPPGLGGHVTP